MATTTAMYAGGYTNTYKKYQPGIFEKQSHPWNIICAIMLADG
jgi:hypothetical protein